MKKNESLSSNQLQILNICEALYQNEIFYKCYLKDFDYYGYLIENKIIDKIKKKVNYEKLKPLIAKDESNDKFKKEIRETQDKIEEIIPKQYKNSKGLIQELLNDNKSFYLIKQAYLIKITDKNKLSGKEIKFKFHKDCLILIFNENDTLNFYNNKNGILSKCFLMNDNNITRVNENVNFKKDLEILVRIFLYNKYLTEKGNDSFKILNKENSEIVYLINNSWMEEYKSFFDYQSLENYLMNKKEYSDLSVKNNYLSNDFINEIIESIPIDYINKINKNGNFDKNKTFKYEYNQNKNEINYLCNNYIINSKIYELLIGLKYKLNDSIKKFDLYFIEYKKLLLLSNEIGSNKDNDEIGFINNKGIFIPEYILKYKENRNISLDILNNFLKNDFFSFCLNKNLESCDILNTENQKIGNCFYLNFDKNKNISLDNKVELINKFLENQIKALISYCLFTEKLQQNITKSSKIINSEC